MFSDQDAVTRTVRTAAQFNSTHWSVVLAAGAVDPQQRSAALERLCRIYWPPIYAFIRRSGYPPQDSQDLTQDFFFRLLKRHDFEAADPEKGRFRSFLLGALKHFLSDQRDRAQAQKRGGDYRFVPLDPGEAESAVVIDPAHDETPERIFDRNWAIALLNQVLGRLEAEYDAAGKSALFVHLKGTIAAGDSAESYRDLGHKLQTSEAAVKMAVLRLRHRYRDLIREEIAHTVGHARQVEQEIGFLFEALGSH